MRFPVATLFAAGASAAALRERAAITEAQLTLFKLAQEYSAAVFCNNEQPIGTPITCPQNLCPTVESHNATMTGTAVGTILDARGFVSLDHPSRTITLSFRGTVSIRNWITDALLLQSPCPASFPFGCLVHTGFLLAWLELSPSITAAAKSAIASNPTYNVLITGHSLGGALATLAAGHLRKTLARPMDLLTFGSPRVGNSVLANFVSNGAGNEYRVTHADDPVPRLPPLLMNYRHVSPEFWYETPVAGTPTVDEFKVCTGNANLKCNGKTTGLNMDAHGNYFGPINACAPTGTPFKTRQLVGTDEELLAKVNEWAAADVKVAERLRVTGEA